MSTAVEHSCTQKHEYTRRNAEHAARQDEHLHAYRCPFFADHEDPSKKWHVGHPPNMKTLEEIALQIRRRQGYDVASAA